MNIPGEAGTADRQGGDSSCFPAEDAPVEPADSERVRLKETDYSAAAADHIDLGESFLKLVLEDSAPNPSIEEGFLSFERASQSAKDRIMRIIEAQRKIYHKMLSVQILTADTVRSQEAYTSLFHNNKNAERCAELKALDFEVGKTQREAKALRDRATNLEERLDHAFGRLVEKYRSL